MSKFAVVSYFKMTGFPDEIMYHCSEPEQSENETVGGFCYDLCEAILHDDRKSAQKERNRLQSIYSSFKMHVKEYSNKDIFLAKLEGPKEHEDRL